MTITWLSLFLTHTRLLLLIYHATSTLARTNFRTNLRPMVIAAQWSTAVGLEEAYSRSFHLEWSIAAC